MAWSWLKAVGKGALVVGKVIPVAAPIISIAEGVAKVVRPDAVPIIQRVESTLDGLLGAIVTVEGIGQALTSPLPGAEKAKAAGPLVAVMIQQSSLLAGRKITNPLEWQAGAIDLAAGLARMLNAVEAPDDTQEP